MPPLPSTLDENTQAYIEALRRRQKDLSEFQIQRLRTFSGPLATQQRYAAELREDLDVFARQVESLDVAVDDQRTERDRKELRQIVSEFRGSLNSLKKDFRAAMLASKRAIDAKQLSSREELLRSSAVREKQDLNEKVTEDALMKANNDVTQALQRTIALMQGELERSVLSTQLLESSTSSLRSASSTHDVLDSVLVTSKHLITALEKSDWLDRMLILAGLAFFLLVIAFILKQRLVDRGIRLAFWWTRFLPDFSSDEALLKAEEEHAPVLVSTLTEVVPSIISAASAVIGSVVATAASTSVAQNIPLESSTFAAISTAVTGSMDPTTGGLDASGEPFDEPEFGTAVTIPADHATSTDLSQTTSASPCSVTDLVEPSPTSVSASSEPEQTPAHTFSAADKLPSPGQTSPEPVPVPSQNSADHPPIETTIVVQAPITGSGSVHDEL
ncbi:Sec20-domain-containing protein [Wolfiporia cocos MD-104 SS10]|uniref:Sec20-domain-containing protein n=1 Tax=Wolfiporia cocos (strain MD-104) TaxID=742152 RepID=A0A2H3J948_WOLCO|nr:Sec20-domain-containing protein [Wolfiporia cocos MD-104 SS10]